MANLTDLMLELGGSPGEGPTALPTPEPQATTPASQIDPTLPVYGNPTTASVRQNFATAQVEITGLMQQTQGSPFMPLSGGKFTGPVYLYNDPTDVMMPATKGYVDAGGGGAGGGGIPEAPSDGKFYTRSQGAWVPGVALQGGALSAMTGELLLAGNPADALGAVPKQYADAIGTVAIGAVPLAGGTMTGLLVLSGDPSAALGAVTKQYVDTGLGLKANAANPTFTGIVTVASAGRVIVQGPTNPSVTLYNTTAGQPCYGVYNAGGYLSFGLTVAATGNPNGSPFATMDQNGNFLFATRVNVTGGRLISSYAGAASITVNATTQGNIFGIWTGPNNNLLCFGLTDASGAPQSNVAQMDGLGNFWMTALNLSGYINLPATGSIFFGGNGAGGGAIQVVSGPELVIGTGASGTYLTGLQVYAQNLFVTATGGLGHINCTGAVYASGNINGHDYIVGGTGIYYNAQGNGGYYEARWDGNNFYYWVNTYGYIGSLWPTSGRGTKRNIERVEGYDALALLSRIPWYSYDAPENGKPLDDEGNWTGTAHYDCGWIAEDLEELIPNSVTRIKHQLDTSKPDVLGPQWQPLLTLAVRAIQQLNERIAALEGARQ